MVGCERLSLPKDIRAFLVFQGSKERQVTEARTSFDGHECVALQAVVPGSYE